jgi:hypothetical protein
MRSAERVQSIAEEMWDGSLDKAAGKSPDSLEQFCDGQIEGFRNGLQGPQTDFLVSLLKVRNIILVNPGLLGKVDLPPAALLSQLPNPLPKRDTNISCHPYYSGVKLSNASTLSYGQASSVGLKYSWLIIADYHWQSDVG